MLRSASPNSRVTTWPRDWITWAACVGGVVLVTAYLTLLLFISSGLLGLFAGAVVGLSLASVLSARRSTHAYGAALAVFLISFGSPVWLTMLMGVVIPLSTWVSGGVVTRPLETWLALALTALYYSLLLGIAAQSWKVALAILACGAASIMVDYAFPTMDSVPSIAILCLGVVIVPAIDTLARASITFAAHSCPHCGYDLRGLHDSAVTCPECGGSVLAPAEPHL